MSSAPELLVCDTTVASLLRHVRRRPEKLAHWPAGTLERLDSARLAISAVTLAEVEYGSIKHQMRSEFAKAERERLKRFGLLPIDPRVLNSWALLKHHLVTTGRTCGDNDIWIAATAHARAATVVTTDRDFLPLREHVEVLYLQSKPDSATS